MFFLKQKSMVNLHAAPSLSMQNCRGRHVKGLLRVFVSHSFDPLQHPLGDGQFTRTKKSTGSMFHIFTMSSGNSGDHEAEKDCAVRLGIAAGQAKMAEHLSTILQRSVIGPD